jgi:hypothetical protein
MSREQSENEIEGRTQEDTEAYNKPFRTRTVPRGPGCPDSTCHDWDWLRAVVGDPFMSDSVRGYTPGTFTGKWRGTEIVRVGCGIALVCRSDADRTGFVQPRLYGVHDRQAGPSDLVVTLRFLLESGGARAIFRGRRGVVRPLRRATLPSQCKHARWSRMPAVSP